MSVPILGDGCKNQVPHYHPKAWRQNHPKSIWDEMYRRHTWFFCRMQSKQKPTDHTSAANKRRMQHVCTQFHEGIIRTTPQKKNITRGEWCSDSAHIVPTAPDALRVRDHLQQHDGDLVENCRGDKVMLHKLSESCGHWTVEWVAPMVREAVVWVRACKSMIWACKSIVSANGIAKSDFGCENSKRMKCHLAQFKKRICKAKRRSTCWASIQ